MQKAQPYILAVMALCVLILLVQSFGKPDNRPKVVEPPDGKYCMLYPFRLQHQLALTQIRTLVIVDSLGVGFDKDGKPQYIPVVTATDTIPGDSVQVVKP